MADEEEVKPEDNEKPPQSKKKLIIIVSAVVGVLILGGGGYFGYKMLSDKTTDDSEQTESKKDTKADNVIVALDPFILNLADRGRYLKLSVQIELGNTKHEDTIERNIPQLRDAIIMLISDKSAQSIATSEGKFQLKDEILFRVNNVLGVDNDIVKKIYFTEFVMQ